MPSKETRADMIPKLILKIPKWWTCIFHFRTTLHYSAKWWWEETNLSTRVCYLLKTLNSLINLQLDVLGLEETVTKRSGELNDRWSYLIFLFKALVIYRWDESCFGRTEVFQRRLRLRFLYFRFQDIKPTKKKIHSGMENSINY